MPMKDAIRRAVEHRKKRLVDEGVSEVRPLVRTTTTNPVTGEEEKSETLGGPIPAWVRYESGSEAIRNGRVQSQTAGVVQLAHEDAQALTTDDTLVHNGRRLFIHATRDLHNAGILTELTVTRSGAWEGEA